MRSVKFMRAAKTSYIVLSALYCVFGVLLIAVPDFSMKLLGILVGCMMIGFGAVKLMGYFSRDLYRLAFQFDLAYGILLIVLGLIVLVRPVQLVSFFCLVLGICILADGLFKIQAASDSKRFGLRSWPVWPGCCSCSARWTARGRCWSCSASRCWQRAS